MTYTIKVWLLEERIRLFILVGPIIFLICSFIALLSSPGSSMDGYVRFLPIISTVSHVCSRRVFTRVPSLLMGIWLMTAVFSLIALVMVGVAGLK